MRIAFVMTQSIESPSANGRFFPLAVELARCGHQVTVIALHHDYRHLEHRVFQQDGVTVEYVGQMHVRKVGNAKHYYGPLTLLWIAARATLGFVRALWRTPADLIQVCKPQPMNTLAAWIVHRLRGLPVFVDSDDYEAANNRFHGQWQQRAVAWFEDWSLSFASGVTAGNVFIADRIKDLGYPAERLVVVTNGVSRARFACLAQPDTPLRLQQLRSELQLGTDDPVVVYVGSMSLVSHALDLLLHAFARVTTAIPDAILLLVGAGEDFDKLRAMAHQLGLNGRTRFIGRVAPALVPYYFRLGRVAVDPLYRSVTADSSFSLKMVESLAAGVPVVTADAGGRPAAVDGAGLVVPPGNPEALADALTKVLLDGELAQRLRAATSTAAASQYWERKVGQFIQLYEGAAQ